LSFRSEAKESAFAFNLQVSEMNLKKEEKNRILKKRTQAPRFHHKKPRNHHAKNHVFTLWKSPTPL
jgi:hypothetical protein